jgi:UDP-3-O-[3-hydroxymyristoyl] glucosamine N-acyltransferase
VPITLGELAKQFDCELIGDPDVHVETVGSLSHAGSNAVSFLASSGFKKQLPSTKAAAVILRADDADAAPSAALIHDNPYACYARVAAAICPPPTYAPGIHVSAAVASSASVADSAHIAANAVVEENSVIGANTYIGPGAVVGPDCVLGSDCRVLANATLVRAVTTGDRCIFHSGSVVGSDGFGNAMTNEGWVKVPQIGGVRIGSDVEIGACTSVDCGAIDDTVIGDGVRLDNQIQIGHNVHLGEHTAVAASAAIAGSTHIGKRCLIAGLAGIAGHVEICDDVTILGKGMVTKSITEPGAYASNFPVEDVRTWNRRVATFRRLDKLLGRVSDLEKKDK